MLIVLLLNIISYLNSTINLHKAPLSVSFFFCKHIDGKEVTNKRLVIPIRYVLQNSEHWFLYCREYQNRRQSFCQHRRGKPLHPDQNTTQGGINYQKANHGNQYSSDGKGKTADTATGGKVRFELVGIPAQAGTRIRTEGDSFGQLLHRQTYARKSWRRDVGRRAQPTHQRVP